MSAQTLHPGMLRVAANVRLLVDRARLSNAKAGNAIDVTGGQMSKLLRPGDTGQVFSLKQLAQLADYFGVPFEALFGPDYELLRIVSQKGPGGLPRADSNGQPAGYTESSLLVGAA